jgi:hypothetical protein
MKYSEETLMAFADGELDADLRAQIEAAMAADAELGRRVATHRNLRSHLQSVYATELDETPPQRLLDTLAAPAAHSRESNVVRLDRPRVQKAPRAWGQQWSALATKDGVLVADAALGQSLSKAVSGEQVGKADTKVGISYLSRSGDLCRSFTDSGLAGIACRSGEQWRIRALTQAATVDAGPYRPASSEMPPLIRQAIDADIDGEPFDAKAERDARTRQWRAK